METKLIQLIEANRASIRRHWKALLQRNGAVTPMAHPDSLVHMIDLTLNEVLVALRSQKISRHAEPPPNYKSLLKGCGCGRNPLLGYFMAGEQALIKTFVQTGVDAAGPHPAAAEIYVVLHRLARRELESFCSLCQYGAACPRKSTHPTPHHACPS